MTVTMSSKKVHFTPVFLCIAVALATGGQRTAAAATELARINDHVITLEEFNKRYQDNVKFFQNQGPLPGKKAILEDLVKRDIGVQEAKKLGLDKDPEAIDRINTVLYNFLLEKKLSNEFEKIHISDDEARKYYDKNPELRTSQIFIGVKPGATPQEEQEALERIRKIQSELKGTKSFAEVAQALSEGPSAQMGGDIDFQIRERVGDRYYDAALKLKTPGAVSAPVRAEAGFYIIKLTAIRPWEKVDKAAVKRQVFAHRRLEIFEKYMKELRAQAKVTLHNELLKD